MPREYDTLGAAAGRARIMEAPSGPRIRHRRSRFAEKGFRSMSRMTLLEGNLWLTLAPQRAPSGGAKPGDGGYPP